MSNEAVELLYRQQKGFKIAPCPGRVDLQRCKRIDEQQSAALMEIT